MYLQQQPELGSIFIASKLTYILCNHSNQKNMFYALHSSFKPQHQRNEKPFPEHWTLKFFMGFTLYGRFRKLDQSE